MEILHLKSFLGETSMDIRRISTIALPMSEQPSLKAKFDQALELMKVAVNDGAELICLPELLNRYKGNTPETADDIKSEDYALELDSLLIKPFFEMAQKNKTAVVLPLLLKTEEGYTNSSLFINEEGEITAKYDKVHPASGEMEEGVIPGVIPVTVDWRGVKIGFMICFDLNYPDLAQAYQDLGAKLIVFSTQTLCLNLSL